MQNIIWNGQDTSSTAYPPRQSPSVAQGWECPRCGAINAPWASQCQCAKQRFTITCTDTLSQAHVNVGGTQTNKVDPYATTWSCTNPNNCHTPHYTTETYPYTIHENH